jgi:hypothetical protein
MRGEAVFPVLLIAAVLGGIIWFYFYSRKRRREGWQALAQSMSLDYQRDGSALVSRMSGFKLFGLGQSRKAEHLVSGRHEAGDIVLADYRYVTRSGKDSTVHDQTVCVLRSDWPLLPHCFLRRQVAVFDFFGKVFGGQDIDFPDDREFSRGFVLQGRDESATRALFGPDVRRLFLGMDDKRLQFECLGDTVLVHLGRRLAMKDVPALIERTVRITKALTANAARPADGMPPTLAF